MRVRHTHQRPQFLYAVLASLILALGVAPASWAAPKLRYQTDIKGDIVVIGNTLGQECRVTDTQGLALPKPVVGTLGNCGEPITLEDSAADVLWQAEDSSARADSTISIGQARSTAQLTLPQGAQVAYARLYWGGNLGEDIVLANSAINFEKTGSGGFSMMLLPSPAKDVVTAVGGGGGHVYRPAPGSL